MPEDGCTKKEIVYYIEWFVYGFNILFMNNMAEMFLNEWALASM